MEKTKIFELSLFIFRKDLRLVDNTALQLANLSSKCLIPAFFLDNRQVDKTQNEYFSSNSIQFMIESLANLNFHINKHNSKLLLFHGDLNKNFDLLLKETKIQAVFVNDDYSPFSIMRDKQIKDICKKHNVEFISCEDSLLTQLHKVKLANGNFYKKYTPYYNSASIVKIPEVIFEKNLKFFNLREKNEIYEKIIKKFEVNKQKLFDFELNNSQTEFIDEVLSYMKIKHNKKVEIQGGREAAEEKLENLKNFKEYKDTRNFPIIPSTRLSAYIRFGCISPREIFHLVKKKFGAQHDLIRQLHWRDFYMKISYFFPHVIGDSMKAEYSNISWQAEENHIQLWKQGKTGFPIVDAAMRCLNETGYMHNRLRMIVSSFFVKDILADWRIGEKYFANQLVDYDVSLNNGGWQWSASTGTDSQPYFRIFNPVLQSEKFDKNCEFIFKWLPELKGIKKEHVHDWEKFHSLYKGKINYPDPIFSHKDQKEKALKMFKALYKDKDDKEEIDEEDEEDRENVNKRSKNIKKNSKSKSPDKDKHKNVPIRKRKAIDDNQEDISKMFGLTSKKKK